MEHLWLNSANLAHLMQETPQQIARWKADGLIPFNSEGICSASEAIRVFQDWKKRAGKMPFEAEVWADLKREGYTKDYFEGYLSGLDAVGNLVFELVARLDREQAKAMIRSEYPDDDADDAGGDDDGDADGEEEADGDVDGGIPPMSEEVRALLATLQA